MSDEIEGSARDEPSAAGAPAPADPQPQPERRRRASLFARILFGAVLPAAILFLGAKGALYLAATGPKAESHSPDERKARLVEVVPVRTAAKNTVVHAMGTVKPAMMVRLQPRVGGEVIEASEELIPGGLFHEGETILRLDPTDYELIVRQREGELADVEGDYQLELGSQSIAQREFELLGESILEEDRSLVLRKPQLRMVEAALDIARAVLEKARLDLARTTVRSPFNALVQSRDVNLGAQVGTATAIATLVGTDEYWVEVSVPVDQLKWIRVPRTSGEEAEGSLVRVYNEAAWGPKACRIGRVVRLAGALEEEGRMARLIVAVPDPLGLSSENAGAMVLLIDSYVRVEIEGLRLENVVEVPRRLLRDGEYVWIMTTEGVLDVRAVAVAFRGRDSVLVSRGIFDGELLVVTDVAAPVPGMPLRAAQDGAQNASRAAPQGEP